MQDIQIGDRIIGQNHPTFIIGELSCNHVGSLQVARQTIQAMAKAGADAIKLQTDTLPQGTGSTIDCSNECFTIQDGTIWDGSNLFQLYMETYTPLEWHKVLKKLCEDLGLIFLSTPYSPESADFLEEMNVPAYKIASMELMDLPFIEYVAKKGKPIILSRGMSEKEGIYKAIKTCHEVGNYKTVILHCISDYPTKFEEANVLAVKDIMNEFNVISGVSDHSPGHVIPLISTTLGGRIIEKHVIIHRELGGPDATFSMTIEEFSEMIKNIRICEKALGNGGFKLPSKVKERKVFQRSLFAVEEIKIGETLTKNNVRSIRPGDGIHPNYLPYILGTHATVEIRRGTPLSFEMIQESDQIMEKFNCG